MSRSGLPPQPELPDSAASEFQALYREAAHAEPDAMLDRRILDAARAELRGAGAAKARRQPPWWQGWLPAASALALALVGVSVTWRVMDQQESDLRREMKAAEAVRERPVAAPAGVAPAQGAAEASPVPRAAAPLAEQKRRAESTALKDAPPRVPEPAAASAPAAPAPAAPVAPMPPGIADEALKKSVRSEKEDLRERRDASAAAGAAAGAAASPARQAGKLEAGRPGAASRNEAAADSAGAPAAGSAAKSAAAPAVDGPGPEVWLKQIRELRAAGRSAEAAQSLARFRARYPDYALPDDLLNLK